MKKLMTLACIATVGLYAAEQHIVNNNNSFKCRFINTDVEVIKTKMRDIDLNQYDLVVLSRNQQRKLQRPDYGDVGYTGSISVVPGNVIYTKNSQDESRSDDDTDKPYTAEMIAWDSQAQRAERKDLTTKVAVVVDPRIMFDCFVPGGSSTYGYFPMRPAPDYGVRFYANDAIKEALADLGKCYKTVLNYGCDEIKDSSDNRTIAIAPLGTEVGVPREKAAPIVVNAVLEFIVDQVVQSKLPFSKIVLLVRKRSELAEYKKLISKELDTESLVGC